MNNNFFKYLYLIFFTSLAFAINLNEGSQKGVASFNFPDGVCALVASNPKGEDEDIGQDILHNSTNMKSYLENNGETPIDNIFCSATVVGQKKILTAAHCLQSDKLKKLDGVELVCPGGVRRDLDLSTVKNHEEFELFGSNKNDLSVVQTSENIGVTPIDIIKSYDQYWKFINSGSCIALGYGRNAQGSNGLLLGGYIENSDIQLMSSNQLEPYKSFIKDRQMQQHIAISLDDVFDQEVEKDQGDYISLLGENNIIRSGDSGGGFFCREDSGSWVLVGVNSFAIQKIRESKAGFVVNLIENQSWLDEHIEYKDSFEKNEAVELEQADYYCNKLNHCNSLIDSNLAKLTAEVVKIIPKVDKAVAKTRYFDNLISRIKEDIFYCFKRLSLILDVSREYGGDLRLGEFSRYLPLFYQSSLSHYDIDKNDLIKNFMRDVNTKAEFRRKLARLKSRRRVLSRLNQDKMTAIIDLLELYYEFRYE